MGAFTDLSDLVYTLTGGQDAKEQIWFHVDARIGAAAATAPVAGRYTSLWRYNKFPGGEGAVPTTAANPVNDTNGALFQTDPSGGRQKYLLSWGGTCSQTGAIFLVDRLAHIGSLSGTTTTAQNTTSLSVSRYTGTESVGNQIWVEIYTIIGTTATTITASYTNQAGTSGRTTKATPFGGTGVREAERMIPLPLQDGDTGVRSVESVTVLASTGTAGNFGVTIVRPLAMTSIGVAGTGFVMDFITNSPAMPEIKTDACLSLIWQAVSTGVPIMSGTLSMAEA